MLSALAVFIGGGLGSLGRYGLSILLPSDNFPLATLLVNVLACLLLGYITGYLTKNNITPQWSLLLGTGFCGGLSTFSTFSKETFLLPQEQSMIIAFAYVGLSLFLGLLAFYLGLSWNQYQN